MLKSFCWRLSSSPTANFSGDDQFWQSKLHRRWRRSQTRHWSVQELAEVVGVCDTMLQQRVSAAMRGQRPRHDSPRAAHAINLLGHVLTQNMPDWRRFTCLRFVVALAQIHPEVGPCFTACEITMHVHKHLVLCHASVAVQEPLGGADHVQWMLLCAMHSVACFHLLIMIISAEC